RGELARAQALYKQSLNIRQRAEGSDHPDVAFTLTNLAQTELESGSIDHALRDLEHAMDIYRRVGSTAEQQPDRMARALELQADIEAKQGHYQAARSALEEVLVIRESLFGTNHPLSARTLGQIGFNDFAIGSRTAALETALDAERKERDHIRYTIRFLPER